MLKRFLFAIALIACTSSAYARGRVFVFAEYGGKKVTVAGFQSSTTVMRTYTGATVDVFLTGTTTRPTLYSSAAGAAKGNPFFASSTDASGDFFVDDNTVDIKYTCTAPQCTTEAGTTWTVAGITVGDGRLAPPNLYSFGATGDGTTDDTAAIAAWNSFCAANGVACYASTGSFSTTASITATGSGREFFGDGMTKTVFVNRASASKPTFVFSGADYFRLEGLQIQGRSTFTNNAIQIIGSGATPSAFGVLRDLLLVPNGWGVHFDSSVIGINSFNVERVLYWPSGQGSAAYKDAGTRKYGFRADGANVVNAVYFYDINVVGTEETIAGHAGISWDTTGDSSTVYIDGNSEVEKASFTSIELYNLYQFGIDATFAELSTVKLGKAGGEIRQGMVKLYNVNTITVVNCSQVTLIGSVATTMTIDATSDQCGIISSTVTTYTNSGTNPIVINSVLAGQNAADRLGTGTVTPGFIFNGSAQVGTVAFGSIGTPANGTMVYCSNCDPPTAEGDTCTMVGAATGAFAVRIRGAWKCYGR